MLICLGMQHSVYQGIVMISWSFLAPSTLSLLTFQKKIRSMNVLAHLLQSCMHSFRFSKGPTSCRICHVSTLFASLLEYSILLIKELWWYLDCFLMLHQCCPRSPFPRKSRHWMSLRAFFGDSAIKGRHPAASLQFPKLFRVHFSWKVALYRSGKCDDIVFFMLHPHCLRSPFQRRVNDHPCTPSSYDILSFLPFLTVFYSRLSWHTFSLSGTSDDLLKISVFGLMLSLLTFSCQFAFSCYRFTSFLSISITFDKMGFIKRDIPVFPKKTLTSTGSEPAFLVSIIMDIKNL